MQIWRRAAIITSAVVALLVPAGPALADEPANPIEFVSNVHDVTTNHYTVKLTYWVLK